MNKLITIKNKNNRQSVSLREFYFGLGLQRTNLGNWIKTNVLENEFFHEFYDWSGCMVNIQGNECQDYLISIEFAKHLAMMAKTEKSHQYRNYFLLCENKTKGIIQQPKLSKELQSIIMLDQRTVEMDNRLIKLENNMTIDYEQQEILNRKAKCVIIKSLGGKDAPAYKECNKKAFSQLWKYYQRIIQVNSYKNTSTVNYDKGKELIDNWTPNRDLELMILGANSQIKIKL